MAGIKIRLADEENGGRIGSAYQRLLISGQGIFPNDKNGVRVKLDYTDTFEIGFAIKAPNLTSGLYYLYHGTGSQYANTPTFGVNRGLPYMFISKTGGTAQDYDIPFNGESMQNNTWYFVRFGFDKNTMTFYGEYTTDFEAWIRRSAIMDGLPFDGHDNDGFVVGDQDRYNNPSITVDMRNTYLKQNGQIIWGNFTGSFPDV